VEVSLKVVHGNWDLGFVLDKHTLSSAYLGDDASGQAQFDTRRTEAGEALFRLKYRHDRTQIEPIAQALAMHICPRFGRVDLLIPMPPSTLRAWQPVIALGNALARRIGAKMQQGILSKAAGGPKLKDLSTRQEKLTALQGRFQISDSIPDGGPFNTLLLDDLFDTGATAQAACAALRTYRKIGRIYVAAVTWK
jgi:predicted amidophosphoribosyltransferase